jgi:hypothetical protein
MLIVELREMARLMALATLLSLAFVITARAEDWRPVTAEELQLKREPKAPNAAAIYLYRQVDRDDRDYDESVYSRIKILTEEGRKHANVEIPYFHGASSIRGIQARVIRVDGSITDFEGTVYDKQLVKARGVKIMAKSFTLPNVEIGSVIEYRYRRTLPQGWVFDSRWLLSDDLFTRHAVFSLRPAAGLMLRWSWPLGLPPGTEPPVQERGDVIRLEARDVPAFVAEDYMPPEDLMKYRVEFVYEGREANQRDPDAYWKAFTKRSNRNLQAFVSAERVLAEEVARVVQPGDSDEAKARKLYARAQQIRNLSFERDATEQEVRRERRANISSAKDVLNHGYAYADDITWLLYGLLRAAKLDASLVLVGTRDRHFFDPRFMNSDQLNTCVVLLKLGTEGMFLDPGTPFMPFAFLPWSETAVKGLQLGGEDAQWITTSLARAEDSRVERKMTAKLSGEGTLEGKVTVTYSGLEAAWRRVNQINEDAAARRKFLENEIEWDVPVGVDVSLVNTPDWTNPEAPLVAEFALRVPGWAVPAGHRRLIPVGLFGAVEKRTFEHSARVHPLYFTFPYRHVDEATIELPAGWQVTSAPKERSADIKLVNYRSTPQAADGVLNLKRQMELKAILVQSKFYPEVRDFYQSVRAADEDQFIVTPGVPKAAAARN